MKIKQNILIMYAISLLQGMVFYGAIATLYRQQVGVSVFQITIIESISFALTLLLELPWGIFAEKIGYRNTMIFCCMLYFVSKIVFWKADGFSMFLLERVLLAIVISGLSGVDISILYLSCKEEYAHKVFSIYNSLATAGMIFASGIYSIFLAKDYRLSGLATVISYGIAAVLSCFLKEVKKTEVEKSQPVKVFFVILKDTMHKKEVILFLVGVGLFSECHQVITVFLNQLQYVRAGMNHQMIAIAFAVVTFTGLIGVKSADFSNRFGKKRAGVCLLFVAMLACVLLIFTKNPWLSVASILALRVCFSLFMPMVQVMENQMVTHSNRATALSIYAMVMDGVAIGTNLIFGKISDTSLPLAFATGGVFCVLGMILFLYGTKNKKKLIL